MNSRGFTIIELAIVIAVLGILSVVALATYTVLVDQARIDTTKQEMANIKRAIVGSGEVTAGGQYAEQGFLGDMGRVPNTLQELVASGGAAAWNPYTRRGWNGPYIDGTNNDYLSDAWGVPYTYTVVDNRHFTLTSTGGATPITIGN